jgi:excisionase family DNA binding protein
MQKKNMDDLSKKPYLVSLKSVAAKLDVSTRTVVRMHKDGKIKLYRLGGKLFAKHNELIEDLEAALELVSSENS